MNVPLLLLDAKMRKLLPRLIASALGRFIAGFQKLAVNLNEAQIIRMANDYDVIYTSKILSLELIQKIRGQTKAYFVFDIGDAVWLYKNSRIDDILPLVDTVTTDNEYTAGYLRRFNANCTIIPDVPQVESFDARRSEVKKEKKDGTLTLGWIGTLGTFYNFQLVIEPLERVFLKYPRLRLRLLGAAYNDNLLRRFKNICYSVKAFYTQAEMIEEVLKFDIGLFPLYDDEPSRVRGILKATIYMSGEAAVVASPVGQVPDFIQEGVNGMIARTPEEWESKIEQLIVNPELRKKITRRALEDVWRDFTIEKSFSMLLNVLNGKGKART